MFKSGLIFGAGMFIFVLAVSSVASPVCAVCIAVLMGLGAGYVAGVFDKPLQSSEATKKGAVAGAITGGMAILANIVAAVFVGAMYQTHQSMYVSLCPGTQLPDSGTFWVIEILMGLCTAVVNLVLTTGLGIAGSAIWYSHQRPKAGPRNPPVPLNP